MYPLVSLWNGVYHYTVQNLNMNESMICIVEFFFPDYLYDETQNTYLLFGAIFSQLSGRNQFGAECGCQWLCVFVLSVHNVITESFRITFRD